MGFAQGLSGLKASATSLDVIGNNIANASTVGFKAARAQFSDLYAQTMHTAAANQVGIGTMVMRVQQQFIQGNVTPTENALDVAINGNGFFRFSDKGSIVYSRNGQLELTKDGYLVNGAGHKLTGYPVYANGELANGAPVEIQIPQEDLPPKITTKVDMLLNLDSRNDPVETKRFDVTDPTSYTDATAIDVYDSLGNMHVLQTYYVKVAPEKGVQGNGVWAIYAYTDGKIVNDTIDDTLVPPQGRKTVGKEEFDEDGNPVFVGGGDPCPLGFIEFNEYGQPVGTYKADAYGEQGDKITDTGNMVGFTTLQIPGINGAANIPDASATPTPVLPITLDYTGTSQYGSIFSVNDNQQDGYASGRLQGFSVDDYGYILGSYSNGKSRVLGQVVLTNFRNPNGLAPIGDNEWVETMASGAPMTGTPLSGPLGGLKSYSIEESTTDLTDQLVEMITAQRVYQANAETIQTQDQIMQTLVNLR
ncbi:MAG: flagellar hook protein FlgE [Oxalobacter formigenes]|nr:flagellar hook protein FlgE [Oxalobacter formigenes]